MTRSFRSLFAAATLTVAALGQCPGVFGDDGFDTGCCTAPSPVLPTFPALTMTADWAELLGCGAQHQNTCLLFLGQPVMVYCDYALISVFVAFPGGETITGQVAAKFARTFKQLPNASGQVWRFLLNGDLACLPNASTGYGCTSPLPRCAFPLPNAPIHFDGHVDYCCDPANPGTITASVSLSHFQGCLSHAPWSCKPISGFIGHEESSYHLVGPAPFTFGAGVEPQGPIYAGSVRASYLRLLPNFVYQCTGEAKAGPLGTLFTNTSLGCLLCGGFNQCGGGGSLIVPCPGTGCYRDQWLNYPVCCGSSITSAHQSFPVPGTPVASTGLITQVIGTFGAFAHYPGNGTLTAYWGVLPYSAPTPCQPVNWPLHVAVGVGTSNVQAEIFNLLLCLGNPPTVNTVFIDLQNCLPLNTPGVLNPGYGCLSAADVVWSFSIF
jgi:hypothetical protein